MYTILIADDEEMIRNGLKNSINWETLDIDSVYTACNGKEAEVLFHRYTPDIILTDIRMPYFSGLELLKKIREAGSETKVILFSGYDDFSYVQTALKLGAFDYILKSSDITEFEDVIKRALAAIRQAENEKNRNIRMNNQLKASIPLLKDNYLTQLTESNQVPEALYTQFDLADIAFESGSLLVIAVEIITPAQNNRVSARNSIRDILETLVPASGLCFISRSHGIVAAILPCDEHCSRHKSLEYAAALANSLKSKALTNMNISLRIGISNIGEGMSGVAGCYQEARTSLDHGFFSGRDLVCFQDFQPGPPYSFRITPEIEKELSFALRTGNHPQVMASLENVFEQISAYKSIDRLKFHKTCMDLLHILSEVFADHFLHSAENLHSGLSNFESIDNLVSFVHTKKLLLDIFAAAADKLLKTQSFTAKKPMEIVKQYISDHLPEDLSLNLLAGIIHISPNYLSNQFHEQIGVSLQEYIIQQRIEKAKLLLADKEARVSDVGHSIGYPNPFYFSRIFKKYTGLSPLEFKKNLRQL